MKIINSYKNGNSNVKIYEDGTRTIGFKNKLKLDYPLNLDIRVNTSCSFANNLCKEFCHESAIVNGKECNYLELKSILNDLPKSVELAIGCNEFTNNLYEFLVWCYYKGYICNLTINQGHLKRDSKLLKEAIDNNLIKGLGVSYRNELKFDIPQFILDYEHTVFHTIIGIDTVDDVLKLKEKGVKKVLFLGEKSFGYNENKVNLNSIKHKHWKWFIAKTFNTFDVVSFDNLAIEQLQLKRFFKEDSWNIFYQGEYSFYIDAVHKIFKPSSRDNNFVNWNINIKDYFNEIRY